jgi:hypothetical protein
MQLVKRCYADFMHVIAKLGLMEKLFNDARGSEPYGFHRWAASLLAIHDVRRMVALDLPWWNVRATEKVEAFLARRPNARVFEYGAGASTAWLARRAASVISVEHHVEWQKLILPMVERLGNTLLWGRELEGAAYVGAIDEAGGEFDLIVIDGRRRVECLARALPHLAKDGIILFDDSGRRRYRTAIRDCDLKEERHFGRSYCVPYPDFTSVLYV